MPNAKPIKLEIIDVYEGGTLVKSLNTEHGATAAAREFADWWEGGLIRQALDSSAPAPSDEDKEKIVGRAYLDTLTFKRRYVGGDGRKAYPEDAPDARREGYRDTTKQLKGAINSMCSTAWVRGEERKRAELKEHAERLAITDADRYAEGLKLLEKLTAMDTLRKRIDGIKNDTVRYYLMGEFPELVRRRQRRRGGRRPPHGVLRRQRGRVAAAREGTGAAARFHRLDDLGRVAPPPAAPRGVGRAPFADVRNHACSPPRHGQRARIAFGG